MIISATLLATGSTVNIDVFTFFMLACALEKNSFFISLYVLFISIIGAEFFVMYLDLDFRIMLRLQIVTPGNVIDCKENVKNVKNTLSVINKAFLLHFASYNIKEKLLHVDIGRKSTFKVLCQSKLSLFEKY